MEYGFLVVTLEPDRVAPAVLSSIDVVIAIGKEPAEMLNIFRKSVGESPAPLENVTLHPGELWPGCAIPVNLHLYLPANRGRRRRRDLALSPQERRHCPLVP
ncbi:MAG: hypothetical protein DMG17_24850 [Acidobacteria bacterium]|nr:MAG: hypothetical protein DMG17_24850 [Acidobacteriota bacterium]